MDFLKKHYEKIILSVVLLLLAVAAAYLPIRVAGVIDEINEQVGNPAPKTFQPPDISTNLAQLNRALKGDEIRLADPMHNLFNPVGWVMKEGNLIKDPWYGRKGINAVEIAETRPLYFRITYELLDERSDGLNYRFGVVREADEKAANRRKQTRTLKATDRNKIFILKEVKGNLAAPDSFKIQLLEGNREIEVSATEPYVEIAGYEADLFYRPQNRTYRKVRKGDSITVERQNYKIVAIEESEVVFSNPKTKKRTSVKAKFTP